MSSSIKKCVIAVCLAVPLASSLAACSKSKQASETAKRAEQVGGSAMTASAMTVTVEEVDRERRTVTLREPDGQVFTVQAAEEAPLERIQPNDKLNIAYQGVLSFELKEPGSAPKQGEMMSSKQIPRGVEYARQVETTVVILSVDPQGRTATFRDQQGQVRTVDVTNPENRAKVARLQPGDSVDIGFTELLSIETEE